LPVAPLPHIRPPANLHAHATRHRTRWIPADTQTSELNDTKGTSRPFVVVLDEQHASRVGQVEIAMMLNRLYHQDNLRRLALEGAVVEKKAPDVGWFTSKPDAGIRTTVALQLLRQGEVSAADFAAMVLPGFTEQPIEKDDQYEVDLSAKANQSYTGYLVAIATTTMTPDEITKADDLLNQKKDDEAIQFIVGTNSWTSQRYQILNRTTPIVTTQEMQQLGAELDQKTTEVNADVADYRTDLQAARKFFDTVAQRSDTMAKNTLKIATDSVGECAPIAMDIGADHTTDITGFLSQKNISYAAVSPLSLSTDANKGSITLDALDRKSKGQSIDPASGLGSFIDGRHKPPPVVDQDWFEAKADLTYAAVVIARAAGGGKQPPFGLDQGKLGLGSPSGPAGITIDLSSVQVVPSQDKKRNDVLFKVTMMKQNLTLWMKAGVVTNTADPAPDEHSLEKVLMDIRDELAKQETPTDDPKDPPKVVALSGDVRAAVGKSREEVSAIKLD
jgi:hypothetical protein